MAVVVVGNPKPHSRTRAAAELVTRELTGAAPEHVVEVVELGAGLLGWGDPKVAEAKEIVGGFSMIEARSQEEAVEGARRVLELHREYWPEWQGAVEIRPIWESPNASPAAG